MGALEEIHKILLELRDTDITHDELGTANGFHESEASKSEACQYIERIMELVSDFGSNVEGGYLSELLSKTHGLVTKLKRNTEAINALVNEGTNQENYPQQREKYQQQLRNAVAAIQTQLFPYESAMRLERLESQLSSVKTLNEMQRSAESELKAIESTKAETDLVLRSLRDKLSKHATDEAAHNFSALATNHRRRELYWLLGFGGGSIATLTAIGWAVFTFESSPDLGVVLGEFFRRALVISAPAVFMRLCISKYNLERNLRIIYNHRDTVLEQYRVFEGAIGDEDVDAKNQFRLEIARVIFSDPETGYTKTSTASEVNINPVLSTFEKVAKGKS